jgi:transposase
VISHEVDPSSIEVSRRARRAKTDRIDLEKLMRTFLAFLRGEPRVCSMVHVPTVDDEDRKRRTRARERLLKERTAHSNRIKGLLHGQGVREAQPLKPSFIASLDEMRTGDGRMLMPWLKEEIVREHERLCLVAKQLNVLDAANKAALRAAAPGSAEAKMRQLIDLKSIGPVGGPELVNEAFYREFNNRRQVGGYFGLTGTPYDSGNSRREQGISKAGNRRARKLAIELAWLWLRHQPDSELSPLVPPARRRHEGTGAPHRHRGTGAQADGGALALSRDRRGADRRRAASEPLNGRATMADVNQERRVTATHPGPTHTRCVDGFRLYWALPSPAKRPGPHRARRYTRRKGLSHPLTKGRRSYSAGEGGQAEAGRARRRSDQFRSGPTRQSCV